MRMGIPLPIGRAGILLLVALSASPAKAETPGGPPPAVLVDRLALTLTGRTASQEDIAAYTSGQETLGAIADRLRKRPEFERRLAEYWLQTLGITAAVGFLDVVDRGTGRTAAGTINTVLKTPAEGGGGGLVQTFCTQLLLPNSTLVRQRAIEGVNELYRMTAPAGHPDVTGLQGCACNDDKNLPIADLPRAEFVNPYWNPAIRVLVCPAVKKYCGNDLASCFPTTIAVTVSHNVVHEPIQEALTLEPGIMAARIVAEDLSWDDVLRGSKRLVTGPLADFLRRFGRGFMDAAPPNTYGDVTTGDVARVAAADQRFHWVQGGNLNAGVLSTLAFQRFTNGWRAKANRTLGAFLCSGFTVPDGVAQVPSAESELIRKPYCQSCHVTLEPLSQFFGRWPTLGDTNYFYNEATGVSAIGHYGGVEDSDTAGLARILTNSDKFNECAVRRAFEFIVGRPMTQLEEMTMLAPLTQDFVAGDKRVWPIMQAIVESPSFTGVKAD